MKSLKLIVIVLTMIMPVFASAQAAEDEIVSPLKGKPVTPGFFGHPLLAEYGYEAVHGDWEGLEIGMGGLHDLENMTDTDPDNFAYSIDLVNADLILTDMVRVLPTDTEAGYFPGGTEVGFVLSPSLWDNKVVDLQVVKFFVFTFYDYIDGKWQAVETINGSAEDLNILDLNVVSLGGGLKKINARSTVPFKGIGIGVAGVNADVIRSIQVNYAYVDDLEIVPIIRKYYPRAQGKFFSFPISNYSGTPLINNNIEDGSWYSVLSTGGAYSTVETGYLPKDAIEGGRELGWVLTTGTVLNLSVGSAVQMLGKVFDENGDEQWIDLLTEIDVVGLDLIGGGKTTISTMLPRGYTFYGFKLNLIGVLDVKLSATEVHYAYYKDAVLPEEQVSGTGAIQVYDKNSFTQALGGVVGKTTLCNRVFLTNDGNKSFKTRETLSSNSQAEDYRDKYYRNYSNHDAWVTNLNGTRQHMTSLVRQAIKLYIERNTIYDNGTSTSIERAKSADVYIFHAGDNISLKSDYYAQIVIAGQSSTGGNEVHTVALPVDSEGHIDLSPIWFDDMIDLDHRWTGAPIFDVEVKIMSEEEAAANDTNYIVGYEYDLAFVPVGSTDQEDYEFIASDYVRTVNDWPEYHIAGAHLTYDQIEALERNENYHADIKVNQNSHYIMLTAPDYNGEKSTIEKIDLYRYTDTGNSSKVITITQTNGEWSAESSDDTILFAGSAVINRELKLLFIESDTEAIANYGFVSTVVPNVDKAFDNSIKALLTGDKFQSVTASDAISVGQYQLPTLQYRGILASNRANGTVQAYYTLHYTDRDKAQVMWNSTLPQRYKHWVADVDEPEIQLMAEGDDPTVYNPDYTTADTNGTQWYTSEATNKDITTGFSQKKYMSTSNTDEDGEFGYEYVLPVKTDNNGEATVTTRAYVPVVPAGFENNEAAHTVLVAQSQNDRMSLNDDPTTGVDIIETPDINDSAVEYYNLQGISINRPASGQIYIEKRGSQTRKIIY